MTALSGDFSGGLIWGIGGAQTLSALRYSRAHEAEADLAGLQAMEAAGLDSTAMIAFFRIMLQELPDAASMPDFLTTHPHMDERIAALTIATHSAPRQSLRLLPKEDSDRNPVPLPLIDVGLLYRTPHPVACAPYPPLSRARALV